MGQTRRCAPASRQKSSRLSLKPALVDKIVEWLSCSAADLRQGFLTSVSARNGFAASAFTGGRTARHRPVHAGGLHWRVQRSVPFELGEPTKHRQDQPPMRVVLPPYALCTEREVILAAAMAAACSTDCVAKT
jgi:hypothetical protein